MHNRPGDIFTQRRFYKMGSASIKLCLIDILAKADQHNQPHIKERAEKALEQCATVQSLEYDWNKRNKSNPLSRAAAVDTNHQITNALTLINSVISGHAESKRDSAQRQSARRIKNALLPDGVRALTSLKYEEKTVAVSEFCHRLGTTFKDDVPVVGLTPHLENLLELNETFSSQLSANDEILTYNTVEKARDLAEDAFFVVLSLVLAATVDNMEDRKNFLSSVTDQQARLAQENKARNAKAEADDTSDIDTVKAILDDAERGADVESEQAPKNATNPTNAQPQANRPDDATTPSSEATKPGAPPTPDNDPTCSGDDAPSPDA